LSNFSSEEITYDANGNQLIATDWLGNTQTNVYDALNRLVEKRDAYNLPQESYFYDESSRQIAAEDVYGRRTTYEYDRNNRLVLTTAPDGYTVAQTYDRRGNVISTTDALGNTTHYTYDFLGRLVSVTDAMGQATTFTYDIKGNLLSQTDSAGNTTYLEYNSRDRVIRKVSPGGRTGEPGAYTYDPTAVISYTYDALGNTATRTDRNGNTTVFEWDVHGNLVRQAIGTTEISYTYDSNGNVLTMTDSIGTTTRVYDEFNRCIEKTVPFIGTSVYAYDITSGLPAGHVADTTTDPKGNVTLREYDRTGRLARVTDTAEDLTTHMVQYTYNDNGSVASVLYPDGAREDYTYTAGNLLETLTNTLSDGTVLETYVYTYDLARNLLIKQDAKGTTTYTYDSLGRVLTVTEPSGKLTEYTYDGSGNRSTQTVTETVEGGAISIVRTTYTYDIRNRLIQLQKHDISNALIDPILLDVTDYTYDHSGNQLTTTRTTYTDGVAGTPVMVQSNTYDVWNQLVRTETENGTVVENAYNGEGRRVIKSVNGAATYYLYEYDKVILEINVFGDVTGRNVYGLNLLIRTVGVDTFYYMYNGHTDVTALLTPSGTVAASYYYDAFGNILEQTGDVSNSVLFAGYQYDKETGLYYLNARMYDPVTARFMQEDTYAGQQSDPLSLNLYTYCHNSPLLYFDPTGHYTEYVNETRGYYSYHGQTLSTNSAGDNMAQREMRKAMNAEFPGKSVSNAGEAAMVSAGYGGDAFKAPAVVYKTVKVAREVRCEREKAFDPYVEAFVDAYNSGDVAAVNILGLAFDQVLADEAGYWATRDVAISMLIAEGGEISSEAIEKLTLQLQMEKAFDSMYLDPKTEIPNFWEYSAEHPEPFIIGGAAILILATGGLAAAGAASIAAGAGLAAMTTGTYAAVTGCTLLAEGFTTAGITYAWSGFSDIRADGVLDTSYGDLNRQAIGAGTLGMFGGATSIMLGTEAGLALSQAQRIEVGFAMGAAGSYAQQSIATGEVDPMQAIQTGLIFGGGIGASDWLSDTIRTKIAQSQNAAAKNAFGNLSQAEDYGIDSYGALRTEIKGTGLESHHIVEKRLAEALGITNTNSMPSIAVTQAEHQLFTNAWRNQIPYGTNYYNLPKDKIWEAAQKVYENYPALLEEAREIIWK